MNKLDLALNRLEQLGIATARNLDLCPNCLCGDVVEAVSAFGPKAVGWVYSSEPMDGKVVLGCGSIDDAVIDVIATNQVKPWDGVIVVERVLREFGLNAERDGNYFRLDAEAAL